MTQRLFLFARGVMWRAILGVCLMACVGLGLIVAAANMWMPRACDTVAGPKIGDPLRPDIWARASERDCSGFGAGSSRSRVEVGYGTSRGDTVFAQDSEAPNIRWDARGDLEIDVQTTEPIVSSEVLVDDLKIEYVVPHRLTNRSLERGLVGLKQAKIDRFSAWSEKVHARAE